MKEYNDKEKTLIDKKNKSNAQKIPLIKKLNKPKIENEEDKEKLKDYYLELENKFIENQKLLEKSKSKLYSVLYLKEDNLLSVLEYDFNTFYGFGKIVEKQLILFPEEYFYLEQIGIVTLLDNKFIDMFVNEDNIINRINLYSYLRRKGEIIEVDEFVSNSINYENYVISEYYYISFENQSNFEQKIPKSIIFMKSNDKFNGKELLELNKYFLNFKYLKNNSDIKLIACIIEESNLVFLNINSVILNN